MSVLTNKQLNEQQAFARFANRVGSAQQWVAVSSRPEPEPDLLCIHAEYGAIAFELVSLTDPEIASIQAAGPRARTDAFSSNDPSERIIEKKLGRSYETSAQYIELLMYTDGQIITPDDVIIPTVRPLLELHKHPFKRVWFMGERETCCLWPANARLSED